MALLCVAGACGDSDEGAAADPTVPDATTSTTVPPFDPASLPPHPLADEADFEAIVRELFAIRDDAFRYLDIERLEAVYAEECPCRGEAEAAVREAIDGGYQFRNETTPVTAVRIQQQLGASGVLLQVKVDFPQVDLVGPDGQVIEAAYQDAEPGSSIELALGHDGDRWVVVNIGRIG